MGPATPTEPHPRPLAAAADDGGPSRVMLHMRRGYLWVCASACAMAAMLLGVTLGDATRSTLPVATFAVLAAGAAAATRLPPARLELALTLALSGITLGLAACATWLGWGLAAPGLPIYSLLVCVLCAATGWRAGAALAAVSAAAVLGLAASGDTPQAPGGPATALLLGNHLLAIGAGFAGGVMVSHVMGLYLLRARERAHRFRRLLALAADVYWELDAELRLVAVSDRSGDLRPMSPVHGLGQRPWELPRFGCEPETLARLQALLLAREPFRDMTLRWQSTTYAREFVFQASGEPRYDAQGAFEGYWGVARNVTEVHEAQQALAATETRYRELFSRIPTPLVLHREGTVLDANPAAVDLFGHADLTAMVGSNLLASYESGDSRERARRRMDTLRREAPGTALPAASFRLLVGERRNSVRGTSVRVEADGGPALLAIYIDDTERLAADEAVRRSEAMLSHLVATSPDLITLTELDSGRYAMVNHSFERISGWTAAEAVGRTALELGVWATETERAAFVAVLREKGSVADMPVTFISRSGHRFLLVVSAAHFALDRRDYLVINARDVTERERQRLEREAILANASIGIAVTRQGQIVLANRHFEQIYGWGPGEMIGQPGQAVWADESDYAEVSRLVDPVLDRGEVVEFERPGRRKDGSPFLARLRGRAIDPERPQEGGSVWIVEDVTERRGFEQALARARDEAEAASRAKSAFLANTSHELRTPLNGMIGLARLARDEATSEDRRAMYLDQIVESAQSLAGIISDILDLSKIEAGKLQLEATPFDLAALLQTVQRTYSTLAAAHGLVLRHEPAPDLGGSVLGDPLRVRQILSNFLANAIKFTPAGFIALRARRLPDGPTADLVRLEVQDSGPGIDAATRARLFQPFTQADQSTTRRFGGTGLGLSICHELATLMGGRVGVDSQPGAGSTFWAELPLAAATAEPAPAPVPPLVGDELQGLHVLVAEDNLVNMLIAVAMLERWGVVVTQVADGRAAVDAVAEAASSGTPFDAVLMDVQMPVMSGHEATRALRLAGQRLPIVAVTAAALVTERDAALSAGMDDFLTKPIDGDKLAATLRRWCARTAADPAADRGGQHG